MRVLAISTWYPYPPDNGSRIRAYYLLSALSSRCDVTLVAFGSRVGPAAGSGEPGNVRVYGVLEDPYRYVGMPGSLKFLSPIPVCLWPSKRMWKAVQLLARSASWDAVVAIQSPAAFYALQLHRVPAVLDVDTALSYLLWEQYRAQPVSSPRLRGWVSWQKAQQAESRLFRRFDACTLVSPLELPHLSSMVRGARTALEVVPNGVDCGTLRPDYPEMDSASLVYSGALTYSANHDAMCYFLAEIYPSIKARLPAAHLTITGSTRGVDVTPFSAVPGVRLTGHLPDIRPIVGGASVCVVPLRQGAGTRLKILEAMALGTPVVSSTKGAEGLDVVNGEHLLIADDPAAFADYTLALLCNPGLRRQLAESARRQVEMLYDWRQIGSRFVELVECLVSCKT